MCSSDLITISRPDGRNATLSRPDQPERHVALHRRDLAELLAEELRRLDPDEIYSQVLSWYADGEAGHGGGTGNGGGPAAAAGTERG